MNIEQSLLLIIGFLMASSLFYLLLFFGFQQKWGLFFFSLFCLGQAGKGFFRPDVGIAIQQLSISYDTARLATQLSYFTGCSSLLAFLVFYFELPRLRLWLVGILFFCGFFYVVPVSSLPFVLATGMGIALYRFASTRLESCLVLLGLLLFGLLTWAEQQLDNGVGYFLGTIVFIGAISFLVGYQIRRQILLQQEATLRSTRLENQLLKRSLQPHFLFNSLMSLQEWIETTPEEAGKFVQSLAEEFRALCKMSGKTLVPIQEELEMCQAHLSIMSYRREAHFWLTTQGLCGDEQVPPAIFHTIIENGLTHGYTNRSSGHFHLEKLLGPKVLEYRLSNDGRSEGATGMHHGTGLRYVEAQLEAAFPGRWNMRCEPTAKGWQTCIQLLH